jgi:diadenosine tetraphosphate (Ap4A) HIT family hydrolase
MTNFDLHPNLKDKILVTDLPLCRVVLEDERHYPWIMLIPRRNNVERIMDLQKSDQLQLLEELDWAQRILWEHFQPTQLNVAALGNRTPQLHVHVIARQSDDIAWPDTVWAHSMRSPYPLDQKDFIIKLLSSAFHEVSMLSTSSVELTRL